MSKIGCRLKLIIRKLFKDTNDDSTSMFYFKIIHISYLAKINQCTIIITSSIFSNEFFIVTLLYVISTSNTSIFFYQNVKFDLFRVYEQFEIPDTSKNIQRYTLKWLEGFKRENVNPSDQVMIIFRIMIKVYVHVHRISPP